MRIHRMKAGPITGTVLLALLVIGCAATPGSPSAGSSATVAAAVGSAAGAPSKAPPSATDLPSATVTATATATADIVGSWTRTQSCREQLAAFEAKGLAEVAGYAWITSNWVPNAPPRSSRFCDGAIKPTPHTHFFTADGQFGSRDQNAVQVDDGDFTISSPGVLTFPSHRTEFAYDRQITVSYTVQGNAATFDVTVPSGCAKDSSCVKAYGWALSAFFAGAPWERS